MIKNVEIVENNSDEVIKLTKKQIIEILEKHGTYYFIQNYNVSEDFILENREYFEMEFIIRGIPLSENFIEKALEINYMLPKDIIDVNMITYSKLSKEFLLKYKENINWGRMITYITTQSDSFDEYISILEENNLWHLISANDLPIDFIREWKDKLDWKYLSMVKYFTDEELKEFSDYVIISEEIVPDPVDRKPFSIGFNPVFDSEELEKKINEYFAATKPFVKGDDGFEEL